VCNDGVDVTVMSWQIEVMINFLSPKSDIAMAAYVMEKMRTTVPPTFSE